MPGVRVLACSSRVGVDQVSKTPGDCNQLTIEPATPQLSYGGKGATRS